MTRVRFALATLVAVATLGVPAPAQADITAFLGSTPSPANRGVRGVAIGVSLLVVGFEFEYAHASEGASTPGLRTGMGNVFLQTPVAVLGIRPYLTTGVGVYREGQDAREETSVGFNSGGGAKITVAGPLRLRLDYRVFTLKGDPLQSRVHRIYAGANLSF